VIEIQGLAKRYGHKPVVNNVSFEIDECEAVGFLGRNGAGKTTTMNMIAGYTPPSAGRVFVDGIDVAERPEQAKRLIGYLPEHPPLYADMTVFEYLRFAGELKGVRARVLGGQIESAAKTLMIEDTLGRLIRNLSKGYRQRVGIAQTLMGEPKYIILDEPTVGLDPEQIVELRATIRRVAQIRTVILSSHILHEVADVCKRVIIINNGELVAQDTLDALKKCASRVDRLVVRVRGNDANGILAEIRGILSVEQLTRAESGANDYLLVCDPVIDVRGGIAAACTAEGRTLLMLRPVDFSLEDVFLRLINEKETL